MISIVYKINIGTYTILSHNKNIFIVLLMLYNYLLSSVRLLYLIDFDTGLLSFIFNAYLLTFILL